MSAQALKAYIEERQAVQVRREGGAAQPWTEDPVLRDRKFCCVIRDDDRTSRDAKARIRSLPPEEQLAAALTFRLYNRVETLDALIRADVFRMRGVGLGDKILPILEALPVVFNTQAYRVQVKGGLWHLPTIASTIGLAVRAGRDEWRPRKTAQLTSDSIGGLLSVGDFLRYQILQDLRWVYGPYTDEREWCCVGPGAIRGLARATGTYDAALVAASRVEESAKGRARGSAEAQAKVFPRHAKALQALLAEMPPCINMFELEHNLCEWDKYERIRTGEAGGTRWKPKDI